MKLHPLIPQVILSNYFPAVVQATIGAASKTATSDLQQKLLEHSITVVESSIQLVTAVKEAKGNSVQIGAHRAIDGGARMMQEAAGELRTLAEDVCCESGLVGGEKSCVLLQHHLDTHIKSSYNHVYTCTYPIKTSSLASSINSLVRWTLSR